MKAAYRIFADGAGITDIITNSTSDTFVIIATKFVAILPNIATNVVFHPFVAILGSIATNLVTIMRVMATRRIADNVGALRAPRYRQPCGLP